MPHVSEHERDPREDLSRKYRHGVNILGRHGINEWIDAHRKVGSPKFVTSTVNVFEGKIP